MIKQTGYVAVRKDWGDGRTWFDMATWSARADLVLGRAAYEEQMNPPLRFGSPVVMVQRVSVEPAGDALVVVKNQPRRVNVFPRGRARRGGREGGRSWVESA